MEDGAEYKAFSARAEGTNVNPQTLLATDYLNHFNEIIMMIEMIADVPECLEEAREWQPKSYKDHFRDSQFSDRDLAVAAYDYVPESYRRPFEETIGQMNAVVEGSLDKIDAALRNGAGDEEIRLRCADSSHMLQRLMDVASTIIHGSTPALDQAAIDVFLES